jgi:hypothetical protein
VTEFVAMGGVKKVPLAGGTVTTLATAQAYPIGIAVDSVNAYVTTDTGVVSVPIGGGTTSVLVNGSAVGDSIRTNGTQLFWASQQQNTVFSLALPNGMPVVIDASEQPGGVAIDSTYVYWTSRSGALRRAPIAGGSVVTIANGVGSGAIAVDGSGIYILDYGGGQNAGYVWMVPLGGGAPVALARNESLPIEPYGIALDATYVYWTATDGIRWTSKS